MASYGRCLRKSEVLVLGKTIFQLINFVVVSCFALECHSIERNQNMDSENKQFVLKVDNELVISMPLNKMFLDPDVRKLAQYAGEGNLTKLDELVKQGVNVNSSGNQGATPLFWALRNENFSGFKRLLELGADPNIVFADSSIMHWAARHKDIRFLQLALKFKGNPDLYAGNPKKTPIFNTISVEGGDNLPALELLLKSGADINAPTGSEKIFGISMGGVTPVLAAADIIRFDIVYSLLEAGADYAVVDDTKRNLVSRIKSVQHRLQEGSKQEIFLKKVVKWLNDKGVEV